MNFFSFLLFFACVFSLQAQDPGGTPVVPNEYLIYFEDGTTPAEVTQIGYDMNSVVLVNVQPSIGSSPGTNIAHFQFVGSLPFPNPYDPSESINSIIEIMTNIKKHDPKADGGSLNYYIDGNSPGVFGGKCYDENMNRHEVSNASTVKVAVFDTGTNWEMANDIGYNFGNAHDLGGAGATDKNGHGTHVASIVNKTYLDSNNGHNTTNVRYAFGNPLDADGQGTLADMVLSMEQAIDHETNVINGSFTYWASTLQFGLPNLGEPGTNGDHVGEEDLLYLLMSSADPSTTLFVVAAGNNDQFNLDGTSDVNVYPAAFPLENMITVASYNCDSYLSTFSNYGAQSVDIAAPGEDIVSIDHEMNLVSYSGTSQATAFVSGAATILGTHLPVFDAATVKCAIMNGAEYRSTLSGLMVAEGVLDIPRAVIALNSSTCTPQLYRMASNNMDQKVLISPTLANSVINASFELTEDSPVDITIFSTNGQKLLNTTSSGTKGSNQISVNLDQLQANGYLLVRIETNEFVKTEKIIKIQ